MFMKKHICFILLFISLTVSAAPKTLVKHRFTTDSLVRLAEIQVINQTTKDLICYVAIDGHKIMFRLKPRLSSKWYRATHSGFTHSNFSTWCDYLSLHPKYQKKPAK